MCHVTINVSRDYIMGHVTINASRELSWSIGDVFVKFFVIRIVRGSREHMSHVLMRLCLYPLV